MIIITLKITKENFKQEVIKSDVPVLLDFWASWCGPCKMVGSVLEQLAYEVEGKAKVGKVNVDEEQELAAKFQIRSIPTLVVMQDGKLAAIEVGAKNKSSLRNLLGI